MSHLDVRPLSSALGAEISGVDLAAPLDEPAIRAIYDAWLQHQVLVFRGQDLDTAAQRRVTGYFGDPQDLARTAPAQRQTTSTVMYIGNVVIDGIRGDLPEGEMQFHTDGAYFELPTKATLLYGLEIPSWGGDTLFSSGYSAFTSLPRSTQERIVSLTALNVYDYAAGGTSRQTTLSADAPRFVHPVVIAHPETRRPALYVSRLMTAELVGLAGTMSDELLEELFQAIERPEHIYAHHWQRSDLVVWDNRCTFHARTEFDPKEQRALRRMTTKAERPRSAAPGVFV